MPEALSSLRRKRIHRSLSRPNLLMGADRELVLLAGLGAIILIFVVLTPASAVVGSGLWVLVLGFLRGMAKSDPLMRQVYLRHMRYRRHYGPSASAWRKG